jgi:cytochrome c oxidase assembly protein subunit 15
MSNSQQARNAPDLTLLPNARSAFGQRAVGLWLLTIAALCLSIAVIGAITRLTESGLSMVEWKPLIQDIPPLSEAQWNHVFGLYQQSPQYKLVTTGMSLPEFKGIFWWEWTHRLFAQLVGVAFLLPFLWFWVRRQLPRRLAPYLVGLFALGGLQGLVGWLMVASGLVDRPSVSHYRLALHLSLDVTIYALTLWTAFFVFRPRGQPQVPEAAQSRLRRHAIIGLALLAITMVWGAFTAGLRAGLVYNTFPLMGGGIAPPDVFAFEPWWSNFTENHGTVQFMHRVLAITSGLVLLGLALRLRQPSIGLELRRTATALFLVVALQIGLGIEAVLNQVPIWLGALHQANAILLLGVLVRVLFLLRAAPQPQFRPRLIVTRDAA